jgi:NitT/TauT family transport system permease protein
VLRYLRFPNALSFLFAGLNTAIVFAVIGAIVGEFVGSNRGIGFLILQANFSLDIAAAFALFVVLSVMGVGMHMTLQAIQRRALFWNVTVEARQAPSSGDH